MNAVRPERLPPIHFRPLKESDRVGSRTFIHDLDEIEPHESEHLGRLKNDPVYNAALGAAELGGLIEDYRGSYIMTFAAYNAGRGSVKKWIERYGDPRNPKIDAVDWVEQIPFSETRNYVERVMENLQVYRARFGGGTRLQIEADLHRGAGEE